MFYVIYTLEKKLWSGASAVLLSAFTILLSQSQFSFRKLKSVTSISKWFSSMCSHTLPYRTESHVCCGGVQLAIDGGGGREIGG